MARIIPIVSAECGTCENWAVGIGCGGDPSRGRCTNYYSPNHDKHMDFDEGCGQWVPVEYKEVTYH